TAPSTTSTRPAPSPPTKRSARSTRRWRGSRTAATVSASTARSRSRKDGSRPSLTPASASPARRKRKLPAAAADRRSRLEFRSPPSDQGQENRLFGVKPVLRLGEHRALRTVDHLGIQLLSAPGGERMHEDRVGPRQVHQARRHAEGPEGL